MQVGEHMRSAGWTLGVPFLYYVRYWAVKVRSLSTGGRVVIYLT